MFCFQLIIANFGNECNLLLIYKDLRKRISIPIFYYKTNIKKKLSDRWFYHCSYSRQNLLSSASCKSNEIDQSQTHITHNNLPLTIGNKFRNQINQNTPPDVLNVNQQRYYHDILDNFSSNTNYNNLKISGASSTNSMPIAGVASIFGAAASAQATAAHSAIASTSSESNLLNSIANNNSNNENR